ncbi:hypothetical protein BGZ60DRAFT_43924 [Tricladium varicosporioides]|nr:hypothetical protein BGZ60DRAFT_43924 [Hymenoscyphus varicosporioides]
MELDPQYLPPSIPPQRSRESITTPASFQFVSNNDRSQIRSHAMRESWRKRSQHPGIRSAANRNLARGQIQTLDVRQDNIDPSSPEDSSGDYLSPREQIFIDLRHAIKINPTSNVVTPRWKIKFSKSEFHPYQRISGNNRIDPFDCLRLDKEDQKLLHHWVNSYAPQAFGKPIDPVFNPMKHLYTPIDLSHEAAVHAILAHTASHIACVRGERTSNTAISHKMAAIHLVNTYLNDPVKSVSDETFSAVLRLLTYERYWGTERTWKLHRRGLAQMIKKRGGLSTFPSDWRLEMRIQIVSLMPLPQWNDPAFVNGTNPADEDNFERPHSDFINFFQDIQADTLNIRHRYPAIARAAVFLRAAQLPNTRNEDRLMCLFYIAIILKDASCRRFDLAWLDASLSKTEDIWSNSIYSLRWLLLQGMGRGPETPEAIERTRSLEKVVRVLKENQWQRMEDRLLSVIFAEDNVSVQPYNVDDFFWEPSD